MLILEIPSFFPPLGGDFCLEQARALQRRGHDVGIISCNQYGITADTGRFLRARTSRRWETVQGVEVFRADMRGLPRMTRTNQRRWCRTVTDMYGEWKKRYGRPDVLHAHCCQWAGVAARMIGGTENIPFYITEHLSAALFDATYGEGWTRHAWARQLLKETYGEADSVITVSEELAADLEPYFGREYRSTTISNVIDTDFFAYRKRPPREGRPFRFCCLANGHGAELMRKGYDVLGKAVAEMDDCELHIAGHDTARSEIVNMFPHGNTVWHGELDKAGVRELLYACDALVLATRSEAAGLVLYEAAATGIPYVTTEAVPVAMRLPGACLVAKTGNANDLRAKMKEIMAMHPSEEETSMAVRRIASPDAVGAKLEALFTNRGRRA